MYQQMTKEQIYNDMLSPLFIKLYYSLAILLVYCVKKLCSIFVRYLKNHL